MKNAYAERIQERKRMERHISRQLMLDCAVIAANDVFGAGAKRCVVVLPGGGQFQEVKQNGN